MFNAWVNVTYSDGTKTGGGQRGGLYEASELLLQSVEGQVAFAAYLRLRKAKGMLKYVPAVVMGKLGFH